MKQVFSKSIGHFIPLVSGVKAEDLATLNEVELAELLQHCKEQEAVKSPLAFKREKGLEKCFLPSPFTFWTYLTEYK